ncbi:hypothetical protein, conserved [Eimeria brunetti]|uniref:Uncharacterized protein n=1 Tax=Eimeria brunetti TaxID=51314 RepID=U6LFV5_9EIME|nr:hypothetical protein, conserved [Eimeria brunetti]
MRPPSSPLYCDCLRKALLDLGPNIENALCGGAEMLRRIRRAEMLLNQRSAAAREACHYTQKLTALRQQPQETQKAQLRVQRNEQKLSKALSNFYEKEQVVNVSSAVPPQIRATELNT